jgi:U3 small nucleolar RNA-associated protein 10
MSFFLQNLLPECIPFLAETLEDDNEEVEMLCKDLLVELEELSGEKLDQYMQ